MLYGSFLAASSADTAVFLASNDYFHLALAILLYFPLIYIAFIIFPRRTEFAGNVPIHQGNGIEPNLLTTNKIGQFSGSPSPSTDSVEVSDVNKRVFLKMIGATGLSFFISSLISKRLPSHVFGQSEEPTTTSIIDSTGEAVDPAKHHPTDSYKISEVDYGINTYYGFIDENDGWFIMEQDTNAGTYRYIKGNANFPDNWKNRENLTYDYYNKIFAKS